MDKKLILRIILAAVLLNHKKGSIINVGVANRLPGIFL